MKRINYMMRPASPDKHSHLRLSIDRTRLSNSGFKMQKLNETDVMAKDDLPGAAEVTYMESNRRLLGNIEEKQQAHLAKEFSSVSSKFTQALRYLEQKYNRQSQGDDMSDANFRVEMGQLVAPKEC